MNDDKFTNLIDCFDNISIKFMNYDGINNISIILMTYDVFLNIY
jgi:hypothetical protein